MRNVRGINALILEVAQHEFANLIFAYGRQEGNLQAQPARADSDIAGAAANAGVESLYLRKRGTHILREEVH
jgi:hypothetical protein